MNDIKNKTAKRVWIYCRVAHEDKKALDLQESSLIEYARQQGWAIAGVTAESGSGLDYNRKGLKKVIEVIKSKQVNIILIKDITRIGRGMAGNIAFLDEMEKHEVKCILPNV